MDLNAVFRRHHDRVSTKYSVFKSYLDQISES